MQPEQEGSWQEQWWVWAIVPALVLTALGFLIYYSSKPQPEAPPPPQPVKLDPQGVVIHDALDRYILWIRQNQPTSYPVKRVDPASGEEFEVPTVDMHKNYVGGEATDLMSLSMAAPEEGSRRPEPGPQEWQLKTVVAPKSKAAYMEIDLLNAANGRVPQAAQNMRNWDLAKLCPTLAKVAPEDWTDDEIQYVHYLTLRTMGLDDTEVGFAALWAAYASNYALWHGDRRTVPGAAYYALAAAHFDRHLLGDGPPTPRARAVTFMVDAEMHRLLAAPGEGRSEGRMFAAYKCLEAADKLRADLREQEQKALDFMQGLVAKGDNHLQRLPDTGVPEPPIGWYIDYLFESINADLEVERAHWAGLRDVDSICAEINARIEAAHAGLVVTEDRSKAAGANAAAGETTSAVPPPPPAGH